MLAGKLLQGTHNVLVKVAPARCCSSGSSLGSPLLGDLVGPEGEEETERREEGGGRREEGGGRREQGRGKERSHLQPRSPDSYDAS